MIPMGSDLCLRVGGSAALALAIALGAATTRAQEPVTRAMAIEQAQAEKAQRVRPFEPDKAEKYLNQVENILGAGLRWHPYFQSAYSGGGFTLGGGYRTPIGGYNSVDVRGSYTFKGYKRFESEFLAPRVFKRHASLSVIGGWREATQVGFFGLGGASSKDDRVNYGFTQLYGMGIVEVRPGNRLLALRGGIEASQWEQGTGSGSYPSVEDMYSPATLAGLGETITYIHSHATVGIETRPAPGYARRGGFYGVTFRDFSDTGGDYGFKQIDYEAIQHVPLLRETWVLSLRAAASTTGTKTGQAIPFFMLPSIGGGSSLRGYNSWRFRDRNSLLLQAEWRVMVNRFFDTAIFYDTGKVTADTRNLDLHDLEDDYGIGFRLHGPLTTPLRIDFAKSHEGLSIVFSSSAAF
jgi:outer membrane protein assembly factor BamA